MRKRCFVDKSIEWSEKNKELLAELNIEFIIYDRDSVNYEEIDYLLIHTKLSDEEMKKMKNCKYIGIRAHNTDYVNKIVAEEMGIVIEGLKTQHGVNAVAEHTFALIFAVAKNLINSNSSVAEGNWRKNIGLNYEIAGKKLGIVGYGKIGKRVAEIGRMFGMEILIASKEKSVKEGEVSIEEVLKQSDIVSLHLSSKDENKNYINREKLQIMKDDAILINTARGSVLDYKSLKSELEKGRFVGVGVDVFDEEPPKQEDIFKFSNVVMTPHTGFMTRETIEKMNNELILNLKKYCSTI